MKTVTIRNVPDDVHVRLKIRAAEQGQSMSDLALGVLRQSLDHPTRGELLERIASRGPVHTTRSAAEVARGGRFVD